MKTKPRQTETHGAFRITSPGISTRVDASAPALGIALSKALTIAGRLQRELRAEKDEDDVTIAIRHGDAAVARVLVTRSAIETSARRQPRNER